MDKIYCGLFFLICFMWYGFELFLDNLKLYRLFVFIGIVFLKLVMNWKVLIIFVRFF